METQVSMGTMGTIEGLFAPYLASDEQILWVTDDRSAIQSFALRALIGLIVLLIVSVLLAIFSSDTLRLIGIVGATSTAAGLVLLLVRYGNPAHLTHYAITNKRILSLEVDNLQGIQLAYLESITLSHEGDRFTLQCIPTQGSNFDVEQLPLHEMCSALTTLHSILSVGVPAMPEACA